MEIIKKILYFYLKYLPQFVRRTLCHMTCRGHCVRRTVVGILLQLSGHNHQEHHQIQPDHERETSFISNRENSDGRNIDIIKTNANTNMAGTTILYFQSASKYNGMVRFDCHYIRCNVN